MRRKWSGFVLVLGYLFLYFPLVCIAIYSFNESRFVTSWTRFSLKWYKILIADPIILKAAFTSIKVASISATISVILGTIAAIAITRLGTFKGRTFLIGSIAAPLVMPEVIMGLSLLMLFIVMEKIFGWPIGRGTTAIIVAHITLALSYVVMIIQSRLHGLDKEIEEAALDLGASPAKVFFVITLPMISTSIILGWLLAFALSLDDVVIASFIAGPGSTTLPMIVFSSLRFGMSPEINALATILMTVLSIGVIISAVWIYKSKSPRWEEL
ncbi:MAG: ABC transporter permease subunit [Holosporaceae bacterium]|jgi:putrescine transport system permease protein|nr:ABC transporter permease subunit [Holosporaceae bacterium]